MQYFEKKMKKSSSSELYPEVVEIRTVRSNTTVVTIAPRRPLNGAAGVRQVLALAAPAAQRGPRRTALAGR